MAQYSFCSNFVGAISRLAYGWLNGCRGSAGYGGKGEDVLGGWRNLPFLALALLGVDLEGEVFSANEDSGRINGGGSRRQRYIKCILVDL